MTGVVLAGGASRRMGQPKAELMLGSETMLDRQIRLLHHVCRQVAVVGWHNASGVNFAEDPGADVAALLPDALSERGPLVGIYTALCWTRTEFNLVLGCDLPFVNASLLRYLCHSALACKADVTVPQSREARYQPLCAVYRRRLLPLVRSRLAAGKNRISSVFPFVVRRVIAWPEIARAGFPPSIFANMNTPEDYEFTKRRIQAGRIA